MSFFYKLRLKGRRKIPTAAQRNAVASIMLRSRIAGIVEVPRAPEPFAHPWQVTAQRLDDAKLPWRVDVAPGAVNDELPTLLYARQGDPRGWKKPDDYLELASPSAAWIERDPLDDLDDPLFLALADPPAADWTFIGDDLRPSVEGGAFCGADDWELELWRAHVILSASPLKAAAFALELPPPKLARYRLYTSRAKPTVTFGGNAGGWIELATLYLLRDPATSEAEMRIRQRVFWSLHAMIVQPGSDLPKILDPLSNDPVLGLFADLTLQQLETDLASAARVFFWTV